LRSRAPEEIERLRRSDGDPILFRLLGGTRAAPAPGDPSIFENAGVDHAPQASISLRSPEAPMLGIDHSSGTLKRHPPK
jgi:hypothetical protein